VTWCLPSSKTGAWLLPSLWKTNHTMIIAIFISSDQLH
jgi:hypothetical protein